MMVDLGRKFSRKYRLTENAIDGKNGDTNAKFRVVQASLRETENGPAAIPRYAVKYALSQEGNTLLRKEQELFSSLADAAVLATHHILAPDDWGVLPNDHHACAMVLLDGSLDQLQREQNFHIGEFSRWAEQLGKALQYLHLEKGICHADLKPGNILFSYSEKNIFLTDFSYATIEQELQDTNRICPYMGTLYWQAPEQLLAENGSWRLGPWVDMYQLGLVFFYQITGSQLVSRLDDAGVLCGYGAEERRLMREALQQMAAEQILREEENLQKDWIATWEKIIAALLDENRDQRMQIAEFYFTVQELWQRLQGNICPPASSSSVTRQPIIKVSPLPERKEQTNIPGWWFSFLTRWKHVAFVLFLAAVLLYSYTKIVPHFPPVPGLPSPAPQENHEPPKPHVLQSEQAPSPPEEVPVEREPHISTIPAEDTAALPERPILLRPDQKKRVLAPALPLPPAPVEPSLKPQPPAPSEFSPRTLNILNYLAPEMEPSPVSRKQINALLESPLCAELMSNGEKISFVFSQGGAIGRKGETLFSIVTTGQQLPLENVLMNACRVEFQQIRCEVVLNETLLPCTP